VEKEILVWEDKTYDQIPLQDNPATCSVDEYGRIECFIICLSDSKLVKPMVALYKVNNFKSDKVTVVKTFHDFEYALSWAKVLNFEESNK
jgi:hypothetical protein